MCNNFFDYSKAVMSQISPCTKVCRLDNGMCVGCFRTSSEISMWSMLSDDTARKIIAELPSRRQPPVSHLEEIVE
jgi:hypothetical protein